MDGIRAVPLARPFFVDLSLENLKNNQYRKGQRSGFQA